MNVNIRCGKNCKPELIISFGFQIFKILIKNIDAENVMIIFFSQ